MFPSRGGAGLEARVRDSDGVAKVLADRRREVPAGQRTASAVQNDASLTNFRCKATPLSEAERDRERGGGERERERERERYVLREEGAHVWGGGTVAGPQRGVEVVHPREVVPGTKKPADAPSKRSKTL